MILSRKDFYLNKNYWSFYCKLPKISPGAYLFQRPFLRGLFLGGGGLYLEELIYGGKFAFKSLLG